MIQAGKQLSNPFSTGGGGARFEANIQATFVTLMLSGGYAPCLPAWPIVEIKLQGAIAGYGTDDLIIFVENTASNERRRLLGQIKHSITITENNKTFAEVIQAAWSDYNNADIFTKGSDVIALITGPISATDVEGVNNLLEHARHTSCADEFLTRVSRAKFCSTTVRTKLKAFRIKLREANDGRDVNDTDLYEFLKHFHLLGYDLAKKGSVVSSLIHSHISQFNKDIPDKIWYQILNEVHDFNQYAGTITIETLPKSLVDHFRKSEIAYIPKSLIRKGAFDKNDTVLERPRTNWNQYTSATKLALAMLLGSWNESSKEDLEIVQQLVGEKYLDWIVGLREVLQTHDSPLTYKNGLWKFKDRLLSWQELGNRIFDDHLDDFKTIALKVLCIKDPAFDLPGAKRYAAAIYGKVLPYSDNLREGLAETMALIGSRHTSLVNCTDGKAEIIAAISIRELFENNDWSRWGSLNHLLPTLSEAHPSEFLSAIEKAMTYFPSPLEALLAQEEVGIFGGNYIAGLLWALEGIAWDENLLCRTAVVLAEIAARDPGGAWTNRPKNSLTNIFLPWRPHTLASVEKRRVALETICLEQPEVGWQLLESLLPSNYSSTSGTHKPRWRDGVPEDLEMKVSSSEYWEQSKFCAGLMVRLAECDIGKLASLVGHYDRLPAPASDELREKLLSDSCLSLSEQDRLPVWNRLYKLINHHRRFPDAEWSLGNEQISLLEVVLNKLAPDTPSLLYTRLFSEADSYLYERDGDGKEEQEKLFQIRKDAVVAILAEGDVERVLEFAAMVKNPFLIGAVLADLDRLDFDAELLPKHLDMENQHVWPLVATYVWCRRDKAGWKWFDDLDKTKWSVEQVSYLLCALPFDIDAWERVAKLLGNEEHVYWRKTTGNSYQTSGNIEKALIKLLENDRPSTVIHALSNNLIKGEVINSNIACEALLALAKLEGEVSKVSDYHIKKIIKSLQQSRKVDDDKLLQIEWIYLSLLDGYGGNYPKMMEQRLASCPKFFCELIQIIYHPDGETWNAAELTELSRNNATNAYRLFSTWSTVPGTQSDGRFNQEEFLKWLTNMEESVKASGHYDVAQIQFGKVLAHSPADAGGLWIHLVIAGVLNSRERSSLRDAYVIGLFNSRGAHWIDPEGKPEKALAEKYRQRANDVEDVGFQRLATKLRELADDYDQEAARIIAAQSVA